MNTMKEATFTTEVIRSIRHNQAWAYKIPDAPITKEILKITRFTNAKPADIVCCHSGLFVAIETKQFKKWKALSKNDFRPEQLKGLQEIVDNGGRAFVFLNIRIKSPHENRLLIFDWATWGERLTHGPSVFAKELKDRVYYESFLVGNEPNKKRVFDLTDWFMLL
jgi:hypothetical protein